MSSIFHALATCIHCEQTFCMVCSNAIDDEHYCSTTCEDNDLEDRTNEEDINRL